MQSFREQYELEEKNRLAPYAVFSNQDERKYDEPRSDVRTGFQRDAHRIYHASAFRRLQGKRQVLPVSTNDHIRTRLTHTLEVVQISRSIARNNRLNEDLTEAIALAHDIGHPPFAHVGEWALDEVLKKHGCSFEHNQQSIRVVTELEKKMNAYPGLNLTCEVLDGLDKHRNFFQGEESIAKKRASLEAQVVNVADMIAYHSHDLEDALRNGMVGLDDLEGLRIWEVLKERVTREDRAVLVASALINLSIENLNAEIKSGVERLRPQGSEDIKDALADVVGFGEEMNMMQQELREFLEERYYKSEIVELESEKARWQMTELADRLLDVPELLPEDVRSRLEEKSVAEVVRDYVASMTDVFAVQELKRISE